MLIPPDIFDFSIRQNIDVILSFASQMMELKLGRGLWASCHVIPFGQIIDLKCGNNRKWFLFEKLHHPNEHEIILLDFMIAKMLTILN